MDTDSLLSHRHLKFRQLGGFQEGGSVEAEMKRNMKKKDAAVSEITANLEAELEEVKKSVLKAQKKSPVPVFSDEDVELVKHDVDKEITNAFIAMGLEEKLEALKMDLSKAPSDLNQVPTLKERVGRLVQEFKNNLSSSGSFDGLAQKLKTLSEINTMLEHKRKGEILKKAINDRLQNKAKEKMEILRKARDLAAKGEELGNDMLKKVEEVKDELMDMLKSANFEVLGVNRKMSSSAPSVLSEEVMKANEVIFGEIDKAVEMGGFRVKLDELRLEMEKGPGKDKSKVERLINEIRDGVRASLDPNELEKMVKSSVGLHSPDVVGANADQK